MEETQTKHGDARRILLSWETPQFMPTTRGKLWYLIAAAVIAALVGYALFTGGITMAIVFIMVAFLFLLVEKRQPRMVKVIITDMGIQYNGSFYPYHHINAFWVVYHPPYVRVLYLRIRHGRTLQHVKIELNHQRPQEVRELLLKEIPEIEGATELTTDLLARILRLQ